ncbi:hypothetical protein [Mucilaginibacter psychrotolerans]|uniref:Uncharacterized protein n=1 Tax=Mucilaginibacter psychrotolerans TaxID=1524096 RepID=A0A4Y8SF83_9SPHI|nr:hypothetical protein [Mucilaginibacter psychrotolerans]TFF37709.1 hypothetical protein E2R66_11110 [Mucilaginibacter psychrotolerans]
MPAYHYDLLEPLIRDCLANGAGFRLAELGLFYIAQAVDDDLPNWLKEKIVPLNFEMPILAGTGRLVEQDRETTFHRPFLNVPLPLELRIPVQESDIQILGFLDVGYVRKVLEARGLELKYKKEQFAIRQGGKDYTFNIRFINDILINFYTVASFADHIAELFNSAIVRQTKLSPEEQRQTDSRPKDRAAFQQFLEAHYVNVQFSGRNIISVHNMKGDKLDLNNLKKEG